MIFFDPKKANIYAQVQRNTDAIKALEEAGFIVNLRGAYDAEATYEYRDAVTDGGKLYYHFSKTATTGTPPSNSDYWVLYLDASMIGNNIHVTTTQLPLNSGIGLPADVFEPGNPAINDIVIGSNGVVGIVTKVNGSVITVTGANVSIKGEKGDKGDKGDPGNPGGSPTYAHYINAAVTGSAAYNKFITFVLFSKQRSTPASTWGEVVNIINEMQSGANIIIPASGYYGNGSKQLPILYISAISGSAPTFAYLGDTISNVGLTEFSAFTDKVVSL